MLTYLVKSHQIDHYESEPAENSDIEVIKLEHGEVVLTAREVSELAEVLSTEFISYDKSHAKQAVSKMMKAQK